MSPKENYVNGSGILDISKGDVIFFGPETEDVWDILRCDGYKNETKEEVITRVQSYSKTGKELIKAYYEAKFASAEAKIKEFASHIPMSSLPYKDFPYKELGICLTKSKNRLSEELDFTIEMMAIL